MRMIRSVFPRISVVLGSILLGISCMTTSEEPVHLDPSKARDICDSLIREHCDSLTRASALDVFGAENCRHLEEMAGESLAIMGVGHRNLSVSLHPSGASVRFVRSTALRGNRGTVPLSQYMEGTLVFEEKAWRFASLRIITDEPIPPSDTFRTQHVTVVDETSFEAEVVLSAIPVLVHFAAAWSGPCHVLAQELDSLAVESRPRLKVVRMEVEQCPEIPPAYGVVEVPTLGVFYRGRLISSCSGVKSMDELHDFLRSAGIQVKDDHDERPG